MNKDEAQLAETTLKLLKTALGTVGGEMVRWRAWETILNLLVVRYYLGKANPLDLIEHDAEFLADCWRKHGDSEETAEAVEKLYGSIRTMVANQLSWENASDPEEQPPPDSSPTIH